MGTGDDGMVSMISTNGRRSSNMKLMEVILQDENLEEAIKRVKSNKDVAGVDKMKVDEIDEYFRIHRETIKKQIIAGQTSIYTQVKRQEKTARYSCSSRQSDSAGYHTSIIKNL
ncbi:MAG: hypothetical protein SPH17_06405 [Faecalicoccus sp.]|uniref:hypothetical protein n=1 Tax=Faecalicoccus sp. TaxID=1971758 RepID=UPI002A91B202|nr:hypothetical protein [Faecalicoccus sp.]MDY5233217.1 hypothetical protein [Faecalicoccus sp.]